MKITNTVLLLVSVFASCSSRPTPEPSSPSNQLPDEEVDVVEGPEAPADLPWPCPDRGDIDGDGIEDRVDSSQPSRARLRFGGDGERSLDIPLPRPAITRLCIAPLDTERAVVVAGVVRSTTRDHTFRQRIFIYRYDGRNLRPRFLGTEGAGSLLHFGLVDLDGDGRFEVIARERAEGSGQETTRVYQLQGTHLREATALAPSAPAYRFQVTTAERPDFSGELLRATVLEAFDSSLERTAARARPVRVARGLSNVANRGAFRWLSRGALQAIERDGFVVIRPVAPPEEFHELYIENQYLGLPSLVTTDTALHFTHLLLDDQLQAAEVSLLGPVLARLLEGLRAQAAQWAPSLPAELAEPLARIRLLLDLAAVILEGDEHLLPSLTATERALVEQELAVVTGRSDGQSRLGLDPSSFVVRGHYTRSVALGRYFRATLALSTAGTSDPAEVALLTALALSTPESRRRLALLDTFGRTIVGPAAQPTPMGLLSRARSTFGEQPELAELATLALSESSRWFAQGTTDQQSVSLLARRRPADNTFFDQAPARSTLPDPLELLAALGSRRALTHLSASPDLAERAERAAVAFRSGESGDVRSVGGRWLLALRWVLLPFPEGYPAFQRTDTWADHGLVTAAASWAELRRDTILYVEPPIMWAEGGDEDSLPPGRAAWVEPNPELYDGLDQVLAGLERLFETAGWDADDAQPRGRREVRSRLRRGRRLLGLFAEVSRLELAGEGLTREQHEELRDTGEALESVLAGSGTLRLDPVPVVADVAHLRDPNSGVVLSRLMVATGPLDVIVVAVPLGRRVILARGPVASFHHFESTEVLTDERWREMLASDDAPPRPEWATTRPGRGGPHRAPRRGAPGRRLSLD